MTTPPLPISLCIIVRDGADDLRRCLASVARWFAEYIVLDTGSTDDTCAVAQAAGADVHTFPWCDDFSAARNTALAHARQSWILVLDADEQLAPEARDAVAGCLDAGPDAFVVPYRTYTNDLHGTDWVPNDGAASAGNGWAGWVPGEVVRLWRNGRGYRFAGRVHETLDASLTAAGATIGRAPLCIHHYQERHGLAHVAAKQQRYRRLLERDIADGHGTAKHYTDVAIILREFDGDAAGALEALRAALALDPDFQPAWRERVATHMARGGLADAQSAADAMAARWPRDPLPHYGRGMIAQQQGDLTAAATAYQKALQLAPDYMNARLKLAEVWLRMGRVPEARALLEALHGAYPDHPAVLRQLSAAYAFLGLGREGAAVLERALRALPRDAVLWNNLGVMRAQTGDRAGAAAAFRQVLQLQPEHSDASRNLAALTAAG